MPDILFLLETILKESMAKIFDISIHFNLAWLNDVLMLEILFLEKTKDTKVKGMGIFVEVLGEVWMLSWSGVGVKICNREVYVISGNYCALLWSQNYDFNMTETQWW